MPHAEIVYGHPATEILNLGEPLSRLIAVNAEWPCLCDFKH
ncbi:MAG: hypothetical protein MnENMB40S_13060 [Rhizobiaceae bacterium MnEN-MB40S]|nr:MAG: hypothetical protein MnENMB40S_13060 [Rhizobiaceae bacterium MnEN-MB40S]